MKYKSELDELQDVIGKQNVKSLANNTELFGGADIAIVFKKPKDNDSFFASPQFVVTPFARELSWLIFKLKDIFKGDIDYFDKYRFYGRLAEKANESLKEDNRSLDKLLNDVLSEAKAMAIEIG